MSSLGEKEDALRPHSAASASLQSLDALIDLHSIGYLHQDIKPQNFAVGKHVSWQEEEETEDSGSSSGHHA